MWNRNFGLKTTNKSYQLENLIIESHWQMLIIMGILCSFHHFLKVIHFFVGFIRKEATHLIKEKEATQKMGWKQYRDNKDGIEKVFGRIKKRNDAANKGHDLFFFFDLNKRIKSIIGKGKKKKGIDGLWWHHVGGLPIIFYIYVYIYDIGWWDYVLNILIVVICT